MWPGSWICRWSWILCSLTAPWCCSCCLQIGAKRRTSAWWRPFPSVLGLPKHRRNLDCSAIKHWNRMFELVYFTSMINMKFSFAVCKLSELTFFEGTASSYFAERFGTACSELAGSAQIHRYCKVVARYYCLMDLCIRVTTCLSLCLVAKYWNNNFHAMHVSSFSKVFHFQGSRMCPWSSTQSNFEFSSGRHTAAIRFHSSSLAGTGTY